MCLISGVAVPAEYYPSPGSTVRKNGSVSGSDIMKLNHIFFPSLHNNHHLHNVIIQFLRGILNIAGVDLEFDPFGGKMDLDSNKTPLLDPQSC